MVFFFGIPAYSSLGRYSEREGRPQRRACGLSPSNPAPSLTKRPGSQRQSKSKPAGPRASRLCHETASNLPHRPNGRKSAVSTLFSATRLLTRLLGEVWFSCPPLPRFLASLFASLFAAEMEAASAVGGRGGGKPQQTTTGEMEETPTPSSEMEGGSPPPKGPSPHVV